jgi:hypothetical protein
LGRNDKITGNYCFCDGIYPKRHIGTGEPFLFQPEIIEMAKYIFTNNRIQNLEIITNGTVPIKPELLELLKENKTRVIVLIDDYYLRGGNTRSLVEQLRDEGLCVSVIDGETNQRFDLCDNAYHEINASANYEPNTCPYFGNHGFALFKGRLYPRCGLQVSKLNMLNGVVSEEVFHQDSVDIIHTPREYLADAIVDVHDGKRWYAACRYCTMSLEKPVKIKCAGRLEYKDSYEKFLKTEKDAHGIHTL